MNDIKRFLITMGALVASLVIILIGINLTTNNLLFMAIIFIDIIIVIFIVIILFAMAVTYNILKDKKVNNSIMRLNFKIVGFLYPIIINIAKLFGISKNEIRKVYVKLNNTYIYSNKYKLNPEDILVLLPHCIQKSICKVKITNDINNCKQCGMCNVGQLIDVHKKYNVKVFIATGGTLARKVIIDNKPKAVIAVACERDLTSGIQDVTKIPVLGVFNKRPNGPCVDTSLDMEKLEEAVKFFLGEC
jgi:hypothetical protein